MTQAQQEPLVPAFVDLRGYEYMPLYGTHLFGSDFNACTTDSGWRAAVTLWWKAWNQVPAASLPNDDVALTRLAELGKDVRAFRKIKHEALHGFVECSDGRLYHRALSVWAFDAWSARMKERQRKATWRAAQRDRDGTGTGQDAGQDAGHEPDNGRDNDGMSPLKGSEGKGSEVKNTRVSPVRSPGKTLLPNDFSISQAVRAWAAAKGHDRLEQRLEHFRAYAQANGKKYVDWDAAFMNAIRGNWAGLGPEPTPPKTAANGRKLVAL